MSRRFQTFKMDGLSKLCPVIKEYWENGIFDEYSEEHFLIKAINNDVDFFRDFFLKKGFNMQYLSNFNVNFVINLNSKISCLRKYFGKKKIDSFIKHQFAAGKENYKEEAFFQALSEIHILFFFLNFGPALTQNAEYEPAFGVNDKNPEARILYKDDIVLDIEVKTPEFGKRSILENIIMPLVLLKKEGRDSLLNYCNKNSIVCYFPRVLKLIEFIKSAGEKFIPPDSKKHVNMLFINWSQNNIKEMGLQEPISIICNNTNGIFKNMNVFEELNFTMSELKKITAIFLYEFSEELLLFGDLRYIFKTKEYKIIMNPYADYADADVVHKITHLAVNTIDEIGCDLNCFFNVEKNNWNNIFNNILKIIDEYKIT